MGSYLMAMGRSILKMGSQILQWVGNGLDRLRLTTLSIIAFCMSIFRSSSIESSLQNLMNRVRFC
jgi:hypothetical protein